MNHIDETQPMHNPFVPSNQGQNAQDLLTQNKNGTTSPLCKVGGETIPCACGSIDNNSAPELKENE
jgi:hypothetical protein